MHSNGGPGSGVDIASGLITAPCLDCGNIIVALASLSEGATEYAVQNNNDLEKETEALSDVARPLQG